jgi:hypothetical protein
MRSVEIQDCIAACKGDVWAWCREHWTKTMSPKILMALLSAYMLSCGCIASKWSPMVCFKQYVEAAGGPNLYLQWRPFYSKCFCGVFSDIWYICIFCLYAWLFRMRAICSHVAPGFVLVLGNEVICDERAVWTGTTHLLDPYVLIHVAYLLGVFRLIDIAPHYYDLTNFPQCEARRVLERLYLKREREKSDSKASKK